MENGAVRLIDPTGLANSVAECLRLLAEMSVQLARLIDEYRKYDPVSDGIGGHKMKLCQT